MIVDQASIPLQLAADALPAWHASPWIVYPVLIVAGFLAGVINTIAGGGSFLTLPALMFFGNLDPQTANATNRLAVLLSTASSVTVFHRAGHLEMGPAVRIAVPILLGVPPGALLAVYLPPDVFQIAFGILFVLMAVLLALRPSSLMGTHRRPMRSPLAAAAVFFGIGLYIGFLQAGMGVLLLVGMSLFYARELVGANAIKNAIGFVVTVVALSVFVTAGLVSWVPGLVMAVGNLLGGIVGARLAIQRGERFIFGFVILVMIATGAKLMYDALM